MKPPSVITGYRLPRYLYHFTNEKDYFLIRHQGQLQAANPRGADEMTGVFMVDLENLIKSWGKFNKDLFEFSNLRERLIHFASFKKGDPRPVVLRVPTKNLDRDELLIRSQKDIEDYSKMPPPKGYAMDMLNGRFEAAMKKLEEAMPEGLKGYKAKGLAHKYKRQDIAVEYIYPNDISLKQAGVERIGNGDSKRLDTWHGDIYVDSRRYFQELFKDTPEAKAFEKAKPKYFDW